MRSLLDIGKRTKEVAPLFDIKITGGNDFETILKRANEALVEITLQTQQQATTLQQQNQELIVKAVTDGLTGLANRARILTSFSPKSLRRLRRTKNGQWTRRCRC